VIEKRVLARAEYLFEIIKQYPDLELLSDPRPGRYAGIVTFRHRRHAVDKLYDALRGQNVVCVPRGGGIRFSPHCYTRIETLQEALEIANLY
jgi:selenocysteine lyase/cysteine desulfurase